MSGTQYHFDIALINELSGRTRNIALNLGLSCSLPELIEYKLTQKDVFNHSQFSGLVTKEKLLVVNALITYRISSIDHVYFFSEETIEFILDQFIQAYEDFLHIIDRNYFDFEAELNANYPKAIAWIQFIENQYKISKRFYDFEELAL